MAWSTVSSQTQSCRSRAWLGMSSIVAQVARRQHDPGQPRRGGDDLFLDAADRQDEAAREISSVIALSLRTLRSVSSDKSAMNRSDAGARAVLGNRVGGNVDVDVVLLEERRIGAERGGAALHQGQRGLGALARPPCGLLGRCCRGPRHLLDVIQSAVTEIDGRQRVPPVWLLLIELFRTFPDAGANT